MGFTILHALLDHLNKTQSGKEQHCKPHKTHTVAKSSIIAGLEMIPNVIECPFFQIGEVSCFMSMSESVLSKRNIQNISIELPQFHSPLQ